jgi:hypothetical protein
MFSCLSGTTLWFCGAIAVVSLSSCTSQTVSQNQQAELNREPALREVTLDKTKIVMGQTLYVPIYTTINYYNSRDHVMNISATLSIRNTDLTNSIIITSVRYYDTDGQMIRQDIKSPVELKPLASTDFFIAAEDNSGGAGANYIVEWVAENKVYEPVIEAVMISTLSSQGISFVRPAKVLKQFGLQNKF